MRSRAPRPLFDRLVDPQPDLAWEVQPLRTSSRGELAQSVERELERLFATRSPFPLHHLASRERTVIDYGLPDLTVLHPASAEDRRRLARLLAEAVAAYEPRLEGAWVTVDAVASEPRAVAVRVAGTLRGFGAAEPFTFETVFMPQSEAR